MSDFPDYSYLRGLECTTCHKALPANNVQTTCPDCDAPLFAMYDLPGIRRHIEREDVVARPRGLWRWHELLPVRSKHHAVSLGEGDTPLLRLPRVTERLGFSNLYLKDEAVNPQGTLEARGASVAISRARELGMRHLSSKTEESALAGYAARGGLRVSLSMQDAPSANLSAVRSANPSFLDEVDAPFSLLPLGEPYALEGYKTLGFELAQAFNWTLPEVIVCPTTSGQELVAIAKAFVELEELEWLESTKRPRLVAVQQTEAEPASLALEKVRESIGTVVPMASEAALLSAGKVLSADEGIFVSPAGASALAALTKLLEDKWLHPDEVIVLINPGSGLKFI